MRKLSLLLCLCVFSVMSFASEKDRAIATSLLKESIKGEKPGKTVLYQKSDKSISLADQSLKAPELKAQELKEKLANAKKEKGSNLQIDLLKLKLDPKADANTIIKQRFDSVVVYGPGGEKIGREVLIFNEEQMPVNFIRSIWSDEINAWADDVIYTYEWNEYGHQDVVIEAYPQEGTAFKLVHDFYDPSRAIAGVQSLFTLTDGEWVLSDKREFVYNSEGFVESNTYTFFDGEEVIGGDKEVFPSYDVNGYPTERNTFYFDMGEWINIEKELSTWDAEGNQASYEGYFWFGTYWQGNAKDINEHDSAGHRTYHEEFRWDDTNREWVRHYIQRQEFDQNMNMTLQQNSFWNGTDWTGDGEDYIATKAIAEYNEEGREIWQLHAEYDKNGILQSKVGMGTVWSVLDNGEIQSERSTYTYSDNDTREYTGQLIYRYDSFGNMTYTFEKQKYYKFIPDWQDILEHVYVYDDEGYELSQFYWKYENGVKLPEIGRELVYDGNHNIIQSLHYSPLIDAAGPDDWIMTTEFKYEFVNNVETRRLSYMLDVNEVWQFNWGTGTDFDFNVPASDLILWIDYPTEHKDHKLLRTYEFQQTSGTDYNAMWTRTFYYSDQEVSSINEAEKDKAVSVYPNPTSDMITINSADANAQVVIYNVQGSKVLSTTQKEISLASFAPGVYIVEVNGVKTKLIKK